MQKPDAASAAGRPLVWAAGGAHAV